MLPARFARTAPGQRFGSVAAVSQFLSIAKKHKKGTGPHIREHQILRAIKCLAWLNLRSA